MLIYSNKESIKANIKFTCNQITLIFMHFEQKYFWGSSMVSQKMHTCGKSQNQNKKKLKKCFMS